MSDFVGPFQYPSEPHLRRHGPAGYLNPQRYKPWLRDEFSFRCVYCLVRERWCPDGENAFSVEHYLPQTSSTELLSNYDNVLYTCCRCNAAKRDLLGSLNPVEVPLAEHLDVLEDGQIMGLTDEGRDLIRICQLDRPNLINFRRGVLETLKAVNELNHSTRRQVLRRYFGFPSNLPRLSSLRPPNGNTRPDGIADSYYELRRHGMLPDFY